MDIERPFDTVLDTPSESPPWRGEILLAKMISGLFSPPLMVTVGLLLLAQQLGDGAVGWALFQIGMGVLIPVTYIVVQVQRGQITDFHMRVRAQRIRPMVFSLGCAGVVWLVMWAFRAPLPLVVFGGVAILQTLFMLLVTLRWKISGHSMTIAGLAVFLYGVVGSAAAPALLAIPLVAWARVRLSRHDGWQTLVGAVAGVAFTLAGLLVYWELIG